MAPSAYQSCFGATPIVQVVGPAVVLLGVSFLADLPELIILLVLLGYAKCSDNGNKSIDALAQHDLVCNARDLVRARPQLLGLAFVCLLVPLFGMSAQIALVLISAMSYMALHELGKKQQHTKKECKIGKAAPKKLGSWRRSSPDSGRKVEEAVSPTSRPSPKAHAVSQPLVVRTGVDGEIEAIARSSTATKTDDAIARKILRMAQKCIYPVLPEAEIAAFSGGHLEMVGASGAKPEVDMVITVDPTILAERLKAYFVKGQSRIQKSLDTLHPDALQKTATKVLSERLTFVRFWRSQFSGPEPMIVLLVPVELGFFDYPIRLNFTVNTPYPLRLNKLVCKETAQSKELIQLVCRWARDRCIANTSKGQPHPYAWGLMVVHFLRHNSATGDVSDKPTAELFKKFVNFYAGVFQARGTPVSLCFSDEAPKHSPESALWGIPYVEDPFDSSKNAVSHMTADGMSRIEQELARAIEILSRGRSTLCDLLERWTPPSTPGFRSA